MAYSSDDDDFDETLPDMQLLLEQETAKSKKERMILPPSLFDPVIPPKPKPKPKPKSVSQLAKTNASTKPKTMGKKKAIVAEDSAPRARREVKVGGDIVGKQVRKPVAERMKVAVGRTASPVSSDHVSAAENVEKQIQPIPQRRRRLIQKKYLISDDDDDDDDEDGEEHKREIAKRLREAVVDLTCSDPEEALPPARVRARAKARAREDTSEDAGLGSCGDSCSAILTYSPPRSSKPRKILLAGVSFDELSKGRKLSSPKKKVPRVPSSGHRLSSDEFWDEGATNTWIDTHTPHKTPNVARTSANPTDNISKVSSSGDDDDYDDDDDVEEKRPTSKTTSSKKAKAMESEGAVESKRAFNMRKKQLAEEFLQKVDDKISGGEVAKKTASTGGVKIVWSKTLRTTAGTAKWRMEKSQNTSGLVQLGDPSLSDRVRHHATIDLSEKVVDSEEKLYNVLCHEYCHLANYIISNVRKPPHGASFKKWASLCTRAFSNLNVHVTTTHSYEIESKYKWACQTCGYIYKRHSQSIDITRHTCGACKGGKLEQTHPPLKEKRPITGYQAFMKENFGRIKAENPGTLQSDIMKIVAAAYRAAKSGANPETPIFVEEAGQKEDRLEDMFGELKV